MEVLSHTQEAHDLFHRGSVALATMECNGFAVDTDYLVQAIAETDALVEKLHGELEQTETARVWKKEYGPDTNFGSAKQMRKILYGIQKHPVREYTDSGMEAVNKDTIKWIVDPFIKILLRIKKLEKSSNTNLKGLLKEAVNGRVHGFFSLNNVKSFRGASQKPNLQNSPLHDPIQGPLIRKAFIPSKGNHLVEVDFSQLEVRIAQCYHFDPTMYDYIMDESTDMHRDTAADMWLIEQDDVNKNVRFSAKGFVFSQFYGDYYVNGAKAAWDAIDVLELEVNGVPMRDHLATKGITERGACDPDKPPVKGTFEYHLKSVEDIMWNERFPAYSKWKEDWWDRYKLTGTFMSKTGFRYTGAMSRNAVINYPVQGAAFHVLLWCVTRIIEIIEERGMETKIVCQIHDSIIGDVPPNELDDFVAICHEVMEHEVLEHFDWITVPLKVEAEATPIDGSWATKEEI
jgi:DNA polymerase-1